MEDISQPNGYVRTREEVNEAIQIANIDKSELKSTSQILIPPNRYDEIYKLIELDDNLMSALTEGSTLQFKGPSDGSAVLCTDDKTYQIKEAETSNTLLLVPELKFSNELMEESEERIIQSKQIVGEFHTYLELKQCKPKLDNLLSLLRPTAFNGIEEEALIRDNEMYTMDKLLSVIQASEKELREALNEELIADFDGNLRMISFNFRCRALSLMLEVMEEYDMELDKIDREVTQRELRELVPKKVFDVIFDSVAVPSGIEKDDGTPYYQYHEDVVLKSLAMVLLSASPVTDHDAFMDAWRTGAPRRMSASIKESLLGGIALIKFNKVPQKNEVVVFLESELPSNIIQRLETLFKVKDKWTIEEITPYIAKCRTPGSDVNALLTKYARSSMINGVRYYTSKHGK